MPKQTGGLPAQEERPANNRRPTASNLDAGNLTVRYGAIGIPAVAAALRYGQDTKNPAYAPAVVRTDFQRIEIAA